MNPTHHVPDEHMHVRSIQILTRNCDEFQAQLAQAHRSLSTLQAENTLLKRDAATSLEAKKSLEQTITGLRNEIAQLKGERVATPEQGSDGEEFKVLGTNVRWEDIETMLGEVVANGDAATDDFRFDIKSVWGKRWSGQVTPKQN